MSNLTKLVLFFVGLLFLQTQAADKYTDENRPYEFGFTIDGEQHRHEKKDENGIIMGEFGFITADGVYHVTVYATDENGNFKILSMKNIRVKPYPTAPRTGVKKSNSITSTAQKDSIPESTKEEKTIKKQIASPAKSCSHCSLPTTTTKATPVLSKVPEKLRNSQYTETYNENGHTFNNNNRISSKNLGDQQKQNISKTKQSYTQAVSQNYQQKQPSNKNSQNENLSSSQNLGYQHPNVKPITTQYPKTIDNQKSLQQNAVPHNPVQINDQNGEQYFVPQNNPLNAEQQISVPGVRQNNPAVTIAGSRYPQSNPESISAVPHNPVQINTHNGEQYFVPQNNPLNAEQQISVPGVRQNNPTVTITGSRYPQSNAESISRTLKGPINKENYPTNLALPQNNQEKNGFQNDNQNDLKNNNYKYTEVQQQKKYDQYGKMNQPNQLMISLPPIVTSRQSLQPQSEKSILENPKGERSPKSFADFIQQSVGPEELASTGPNLYRPSLPKASEFSGKPVLLAAQMQKVDKKTDIYNKNPGESNGLPKGITLDDVKNLLYTFNYTVGFHGHHEKGYSNGVKQGYYYVTGRNGVKTRVDYIADENGFQPKITQEILNVVSDEVPKPETEKDEKYGLKGYEFKWLYFPLDSQSV